MTAYDFFVSPLGILTLENRTEHCPRCASANRFCREKIKNRPAFKGNTQTAGTIFCGERRRLTFRFIWTARRQRKSVAGVACGPTVRLFPINKSRNHRHPKAYRAVGTAITTTPLPSSVPCHRVIPANSALAVTERVSPQNNICWIWNAAT